MSDVINEALLEMHFHPAIKECFESVFGARVLRMLKPSPQQEVWVGFDQAWVKTEYTTREILDDLRSSIHGGSPSERFYLGYFLQFKLMQHMIRRSGYLPDGYQTPYYRSELSLTPNKHTRLSQHETLLRLTSLPQTDVNYVCAIIHSADEIYDPPDIDKLVCVDVKSSPSGWATGSRHFITVQDLSGAAAHWCSDPVEASSMPFFSWAASEARLEQQLSGEEAALLITSATRLLSVQESRVEKRAEPTGEISISTLPESFILLELEPAE